MIPGSPSINEKGAPTRNAFSKMLLCNMFDFSPYSTQRGYRRRSNTGAIPTIRLQYPRSIQIFSATALCSGLPASWPPLRNMGNAPRRDM